MTFPVPQKAVDERSYYEENEFPNEKVGVGHRWILNGQMSKTHD